MKCEKKIVINNPFLTRLRRNLRAILREAYFAEFGHFRALDRLYRIKMAQIGKLTPSQWKRRSDLARKEDDLIINYRNSVLSCIFGPLCITAERSLDILDVDMVRVPFSYGWMCLPCFEHLSQRKQDNVSQEELQNSFETTNHITELLRKEFESKDF